MRIIDPPPLEFMPSPSVPASNFGYLSKAGDKELNPSSRSVSSGIVEGEDRGYMQDLEKVVVPFGPSAELDVVKQGVNRRRIPLSRRL